MVSNSMFNQNNTNHNYNIQSIYYDENNKKRNSKDIYIHPSHPIKGSRLSEQYLSSSFEHFDAMQTPSPTLRPSNVSWTDNVSWTETDDIPFTMDDEISTFPIELPASPPLSSARSSKWSLSSISKSNPPPVSRRYSGIAHFYQPNDQSNINAETELVGGPHIEPTHQQQLNIPELEGTCIGDKKVLCNGKLLEDQNTTDTDFELDSISNHGQYEEHEQDRPRRRSLYIHGGQRLYTVNACTAASAPSESSLLFSSISPRDVSLVLPAPDLIMDTTPELEYAFPRPRDMNL